MPGTGCDLAIKLNGETYFVAVTAIDEHGDTHSEDGLCHCSRQAKVTGKVKEGRLVAVAYQLLPLDTVTEQAASDQNYTPVKGVLRSLKGRYLHYGMFFAASRPALAFVLCVLVNISGRVGCIE